MHVMQSHWDFNIALDGKHWGRVTWDWSNNEADIRKKCRTIMVAMGPKYTYGLTLWQGQGNRKDLTDENRDVDTAWSTG